MLYAAQKREIRANVEVRMAALLPEKRGGLGGQVMDLCADRFRFSVSCVLMSEVRSRIF